ncbi:hypothetical protein PDESU_03446 [Pontiella desulfatans]|uniref:Uncharacterized protein n=2 Tax=Pontiella desulfatans TaxID=2750659 RepID=A0A6C2U657_PONDE|nr:hypothetical protein PDESU_03446 [Pontiella desulfatans]
MKKAIRNITLAVSVTTLTASAVNQRWEGTGGDGLWTNAANWSTTSVPAIGDNTANWTGDAITIDTAAFADRFWARGGLGKNVLTITNNGILTTAGDIALNEFSNNEVYADLIMAGGAAIVSNNLSVAGQDTSQGGGRVFLNSGSVEVLNSVKIGTAGQGVGVDGEVTINDGTLSVLNRTLVGGGNLDTDEGTLIINGGQYIEGTNGSSFAIGVGAGSGTVEINGGMLVNNNALKMDVDASNDVGTATINLNGGEWWQLGSSVDMQDESQIIVGEGVMHWAGDQLAAVTALVTNGFLTPAGGPTNMLAESWDASWTNSTVVDYGYWSNTYTRVLFADVDDVTNGYTTVWAQDLTPPPPGLPESDGVANTHSFNNGGGDQLWSTAGNWNPASVPTGEDTAKQIEGGTLIVASEAEVLALLNGHNNTSLLAVVTGGSLTVSNNAEIGNDGGSGLGKLVVDGGDVSVLGELSFGKKGTATRRGELELNSGTVNVGGATLVGNQATGTVTINGGVFNQPYTVFKVAGSDGSGTLNVNGGSLELHTGNDVWQPLQVGTGAGDGVVNMRGGLIRTRHLVLGNNNAGAAEVNLYGGTFDLAHGWTGSLFMRSEGKIHVEGGVFKWNGTDKLPYITNLVAQGQMTWDNGMTNMLSESWDHSWTNGTSILYAEAAGGYTTVWAFDTTSVPAGYDAFETLYDLQEGAEGDDDKDGLSNLGEYAINGNPTNAADTGQMGMSSDGSTFAYVHAKLADDSSVTYRLIDTTDLVNGSVTTNGYVSQVNGPVDGDYLTVTNNYDMTGKPEQFIELEVEQQ